MAVRTMEKWVVTGPEGAVKGPYLVGPNAEESARSAAEEGDSVWCITEVWATQ